MITDPETQSQHLSRPEDWTSIMRGNRVHQCLQQILDHELPSTFGYYGLALGPLSQQLDFSASPVRHWFSAQDRLVGEGDCLIDYEALPVASDSMDVVVMPHLLDFLTEPHQVLREAERVVIPDGKLIITGINPFSWYGGRHLSCRLMKKQCREKRLLGLARMKDWLMLLGFKVECYRDLEKPMQKANESAFSEWLQPFTSHFYSHYIIIAKKCVSTLTPIRPSWRSNRKLVPARFAEPGVRRLVERELKKSQH